jgi:hypothetical protein
VVLYAACSYCLSRAERLDGSYLRTFALELKEELAQTLTAFVMSILTQPGRRLDGESVAEPLLRQIIDVLEQVMCTHDAEKIAISVLEVIGPLCLRGGRQSGRNVTASSFGRLLCWGRSVA